MRKNHFQKRKKLITDKWWLSSHRNDERCSNENRFSIFCTVDILLGILHCVNTLPQNPLIEIANYWRPIPFINIETNFTRWKFFFCIVFITTRFKSNCASKSDQKAYQIIVLVKRSHFKNEKGMGASSASILQEMAFVTKSKTVSLWSGTEYNVFKSHKINFFIKGAISEVESTEQSDF